jgi:hypothetical protein
MFVLDVNGRTSFVVVVANLIVSLESSHPMRSKTLFLWSELISVLPVM